MRGPISQELAEVVVEDERGQPFPLSQTWAAGTGVLVFLRHFG